MPVEHKPTEDLTYWESAGVDDDGVDQALAPVVVRGRLIIGKREIQNGLSGAFSIDAILTDIDFSIPIHSFITQETIPNLDAQNPPVIFEVVELREVPDIKGRNIRRTGLMIRYKKKLPPTP